MVLALGTRLSPFSTLPGYGIDYWPKDAKIIQVDINPNRIGLTKPVSVGIVGDAAKMAETQQLSSMDHEEDDPGTSWNARAHCQTRLDEPAHGLACNHGRPALRSDHQFRHRQ